jgi:type IV secretion system protein VirB8
MTVPSKELDEYFKQSRTFDGERALAAVRSKKRAWMLAAGSGVLAAASILAVVAMLPLRTVEVHVFRVDNATGMVDLVQPLRGSQTYNEAVTKYFAMKYVRAREGYLVIDAKEGFRAVALMSSADEQQRFAEWSSPRNPKSNAALLGASGRADIAIKSVTFPSKGLALVRFSRTVTHDGRTTVSNHVATLGFEFVAADMAESDRGVNPLGFVVSQYRNDAETL